MIQMDLKLASLQSYVMFSNNKQEIEENFQMSFTKMSSLATAQ